MRFPLLPPRRAQTEMGGPAGASPPAVVPPLANPAQTPFDLALAWVLSALKVRNGAKALTDIDMSALRPMLDAVQAGWGPAAYPFDALDVGANFAGGTVDILRRILNRTAQAPIDDLVFRLMGISVFTTIAVAGGIVNLAVIGPTGGYRLRSFALGAAGSTSDAQSILTGIPTSLLRLPVGYSLQVTIPATGAAETVRVNTVWAMAPAGFALGD